MVKASGGKLVLLGLHSGLVAGIAVDAILCGASKVKGSGIGGIEATQAVIDLCAKHNIKPDIELVPADDIYKVFEGLDGANDSGKRYVIDIATLNEGTMERCAQNPPPKFGPPPPPLSPLSITSAICKLLCCCRWC